MDYEVVRTSKYIVSMKLSRQEDGKTRFLAFGCQEVLT